MAVTSIWSIKGWIGKVINYAENPDKTKENNEGRISENQSRSIQGLNDVITYAVNAEKIRRRQSESMEMELVGEAEELMEQYVSGVNCAPTTAREEMIAVKKRFGKEDGIVAFHGYQSFAPGECNPAMAHEIGKKLAEELWGSQYQVLIATHLDKANHLHNHFVVNSVSSIDGKRYHRTNQDYRDMRMVSDRLCKEYQLSVVRQPEQGKGKHYMVGTRETPCVVKVYAKENLENYAISGFGESDIIIEDAAAGETIVIDGMTGMVTSNGASAFDRVDLWEFPVLRTGETSLSFSSASAIVKMRYKPMWI